MFSLYLQGLLISDCTPNNHPRNRSASARPACPTFGQWKARGSGPSGWLCSIFSNPCKSAIPWLYELRSTHCSHFAQQSVPPFSAHIGQGWPNCYQRWRRWFLHLTIWSLTSLLPLSCSGSAFLDVLWKVCDLLPRESWAYRRLGWYPLYLSWSSQYISDSHQ